MAIENSYPATPLFKQDEAPSLPSVTLLFEGRAVQAPAGSSVAAALLLNGVEPFRTTPVRSVPRAPYCMMGVCFDCLVDIDDVPSRQACQVLVKEGMRVRRQDGASVINAAPTGGFHG